MEREGGWRSGGLKGLSLMLEMEVAAQQKVRSNKYLGPSGSITNECNMHSLAKCLLNHYVQ